MKTTGLNFIEAVQAAKEGHKVRRKDWVGDAYVSLRGEKLFYISDNYDEALESYYDHITATDWEIVLEPPKTMAFQEAIEHLLQHGGKVKRQSNSLSMRIDLNALNVANSFTKLLVVDIKADDWIEVKEKT